MDLGGVGGGVNMVKMCDFLTEVLYMSWSRPIYKTLP